MEMMCHVCLGDHNLIAHTQMDTLNDEAHGLDLRIISEG